ncbi:MAG: hypothetical protein KI793_22605 [Rivularia sp. (in: Bacteria)]|nr:hypothetical protein [Rivularia sp. MS3]
MKRSNIRHYSHRLRRAGTLILAQANSMGVARNLLDILMSGTHCTN